MRKTVSIVGTAAFLFAAAFTLMLGLATPASAVNDGCGCVYYDCAWPCIGDDTIGVYVKIGLQWVCTPSEQCNQGYCACD